MVFFSNLHLRFLGAVQFLTVVPVHRSTVPVHKSAPFFPLVAALIGLLTSAPVVWLPLPAGITAAIILMLQLAITGMLHEDGLADIADGVRAGREREKMFEIIKDSRIGSYGACALCVGLLLRWQGLVALLSSNQPGWQVVASVAAAEGLSRCAILWLGLVTPAAKAGMGAYLSENRSWVTATASIAMAASIFLWVDPQRAIALLVGLVVLMLLARQYFIARLGGVVGDCFGALQQACVIYCLVVFAWQRS